MGLRRRDEAGHHRLTIEPDGAGATFTFRTALLRAGESRFLAECIEEGASGRRNQLHAATVDAGRDYPAKSRTAGREPVFVQSARVEEDRIFRKTGRQVTLTEILQRASKEIAQ